MKAIKYYLGFIRGSQSFMKGHNPIVTFFKSLYLGFRFTWDCMIDDKQLGEVKNNGLNG